MSYNWNYNYPQIARDSGFNLRQFKEGTLDWSLLGSVEVDEVVRNQNYERIDNLIFPLSEAPLAPIVKSNVLDSGVAKYFGLAQLGIQYLLFCKKFLDETVSNLRDVLRDVQLDNAKLKAVNADSNNELLQLHKKLQRVEEINEVLYPCSMCTKNFISNEMLNTHISRKHSQNLNDSKSMEINDRTLINTIKLELEIKQLKERLNAAESKISEHNLFPTEDNRSGKIVFEKGIDSREASTQTYLLTQSIGIQTNLIDDKEVDDVIDSELRKSNEILTEIRTKFTNLEEWKTQQVQENHSSIREILEKLEEVEETIGRNDLNKVEVQDFLRETIKNLDVTYVDKLNQIINKIEISAKNNDLVDRQNEIIRISKRDEESQTKIENLPKTTAVLSQSMQDAKIIIMKPAHEPTNNETSETVAQTTSFQLKDSDEYTQPDFEILPAAKKKPMKITEQIKNQGTVSKLKRPPSPVKKINTKAILAKRLSALGLTTNSKTLSSNAFGQILELIAKEHSVKKKKYPNFFVTRNRLKTFVEKLSKNKLKSTDYLESEKVTDLMSHSNNFDYTGLVQSKAESETSCSFKSYQKKTNVNNDSNNTKTIESSPMRDFKNRLEKVLSSPIKRPEITQSILAHGVESEGNIQSENGFKKPVPIPRKKVMFDLRTTDSEDSL